MRDRFGSTPREDTHRQQNAVSDTAAVLEEFAKTGGILSSPGMGAPTGSNVGDANIHTPAKTPLASHKDRASSPSDLIRALDFFDGQMDSCVGMDVIINALSDIGIIRSDPRVQAVVHRYGEDASLPGTTWIPL